MLTASIAEAKKRLEELVEKAAGGEAIIITKWGKPIARIIPCNDNVNDF